MTTRFVTAGGISETVIAACAAVRIPDDVPLDIAALLGCSVLSGVGAALNTATISPGDAVAVVGCGGVGLNVIQGARIAGAEIIVAVDVHQSKLDTARAFGATHTVDATRSDPANAVRDLTGQRGADVAFEVLGFHAVPLPEGLPRPALQLFLGSTIGNFAPKFKDMSWRPGVWICTAIMVAGWGYILILGVTDPLGGINTFFPLFGIANQLLAAIALAVCMAIAAKKGVFKYLWIIALPLAFAAVITIWASILKIFSPDVRVGYWANHFAHQEALANGETSLGNAGSVEAMEAVVRNTWVQGTLSIVFVVLTIIVIATAIIATIKSWQRGGEKSHEDPAVVSATYAPAGFIATPPERELQKRWDELPQDKRLARSKH